MGLAASQAKLLSITSRLSDNELRSQSITAAKMGLAHETAEASRKYINALNNNEFIYRTYDQNGEKCYVPLTGTQLTTYGPLKNQYCLVNPKGQIMVSELDGKNYETSANINEFLEKYGIESIPTGETKTVVNPEYADAYTRWLTAHEEWELAEPPEFIEKLISGAYDEEVVDSDNELYQKFTTASNACRSSALSGSASCYMHVLAHLLDLQTDGNGNPTGTWPRTYQTSVPGVTIEYNKREITDTNIHGAGQTENMVEVSNAVCNGYKGKTLMATPDSSFVSRFDLTDSDYNTATATQRLLSNYTFDASDHATLKTLKQKCIDMAYLIKNYEDLGVSYSPDMIDLIKSFEEDMSLAFKEIIHHDAVYEKTENPEYQSWLLEEPKMEDLPKTIDENVIEYSDTDKAQWYVNLWHRMNGPSQKKYGMITTSSTTNVTTTEYGTNYTGTSTTVTTTTTGPRWYVLEDGLMNSQDWLKYALETGAVSLERVNFTNPTETGTGLKDATWTSIIYTNALDISEQQNEKAIAIAEAEYEQKSREIENKDKQYDSILKLLDTEHSALQQELETAKTVITKNTERTLKMYSA